VGSRYEEVCRSIKLDRFANLDLQAEINKYVASLPNLAINAGQIPYSTLLQKEGGTGTWVELEDSGSLWTVRLLPREPNELTVATDRPTTPSCTQTEMLGNSGASTTPRDWCVGGCSITSGDSGFPGGGRLPDADGERRSGLDVLVGGGRADKYYNGFSSTARECNSDFDIDWYIDLSHSSNEDNN